MFPLFFTSIAIKENSGKNYKVIRFIERVVESSPENIGQTSPQHLSYNYLPLNDIVTLSARNWFSYLSATWNPQHPFKSINQFNEEWNYFQIWIRIIKCTFYFTFCSANQFKPYFLTHHVIYMIEVWFEIGALHTVTNYWFDTEASVAALSLEVRKYLQKHWN